MDQATVKGGSRTTDLWPGEVYKRPMDGKLFKLLRIERPTHGQAVVHYWDIEKELHLKTTKVLFDKLFVLDYRSCEDCGRHPSACICVEGRPQDFM